MEGRMRQLLLYAHDGVCLGSSNVKQIKSVLSNCVEWIE
jgi:hypothetical protein